MQNNEPNKIVKALWKRLEVLSLVQDADKYDWKAQDAIKDELFAITHVVGAIEVMSRDNLLRLVTMQSKLRFMAHHSFYIQFSKACEDSRL